MKKIYFLYAGTQLGNISNASVDLCSYFKVIGSQEVHISKQFNNEKRVKLLVKVWLFSKHEHDVSYTDRVTHRIHLTDDTRVKKITVCTCVSTIGH